MFEYVDDQRVFELPSTALSGDTYAASDDDADATFPNARSANTTADCADVAGAPAPDAFDAVTTTRTVCPTSAAATTYPADDAPAISTHAPPAASHRRH